jgi:hypothetical protein
MMESHEQLARKLVKLTGTEEDASTGLLAIFSGLAQGNMSLVKDLVLEADSRVEEYLGILSAELMSEFTCEELDVVVKFYESEAGNKFLSKYNKVQMKQASALGKFIASVVENVYKARDQVVPEGWEEILSPNKDTLLN